MKLSLHSTSASALTTLLSNPALDEITAEAVAEAYLAEGYSRVDVDSGPGQIRVVAVRDGARVETVLDRAGGACLARTVRQLKPGENLAPGKAIRISPHDFVGRAPGSRQPLAGGHGEGGATDV